MSKASQRNDQDSTSSGQGALGMGGQPDDDPRDQAGGHEDLTGDDRPRHVDGASGSAASDHSGGGTPNEVTGVGGDKAVDQLD